MLPPQLLLLLLLMPPHHTASSGSSATVVATVAAAEAPLRTCEPIRIDLCRGIGYNETAMPNLVGHEVQSDADFTLHTFLPLIQYGCSAQLHFFLCAAYLPMCTPKVRVPIGPCRNLCETVRARCHPVLQGFGFPWPAALDCGRFPADNNHEHMCMEGPGEPGDPPVDSVAGSASSPVTTAVAAAAAAAAASAAAGGGVGLMAAPHPPGRGLSSGAATVMRPFTCHGLVKSHLYVRLNRSSVGRCAALCEANILFDQREKAVAEVWVTVWSVAALVTAVAATLCLIVSDTKWDHILVPLVTCGSLVTVGWTVRWLAGRSRTACGMDAQYPGVSLLLVDGMGNAPCAVTFLLRYYFGMAANVWWAILCLKWHFAVRRGRLVGDYNTDGGHPHQHSAQQSHQHQHQRHRSPQHQHNHHRNGDVSIELMAVNGGASTTTSAAAGAAPLPAAGQLSAVFAAKAAIRPMKTLRGRMRTDPVAFCSLTHLVAWGLPVVQTVAVIMAQLVDADELLGACFVGNQSDKALRVVEAMPLFCYWIFGSVNLFAGYLVQRRDRHHHSHHPHPALASTTTATSVAASPASNSTTTIGGMGVFLFIYSIPCAALMVAVFYEFANRDIWLNEPPPAAAGGVRAAAVKAAMWPFLLRAFMELLVGVLASSWVLGPRVSTVWRSARCRWLAVRGPPLQKLGVAGAPSIGTSVQQQQQHQHSQQSLQHQHTLPHLQSSGASTHSASLHQLHQHQQHQQPQHSAMQPAYPHQYPLSVYSTASYQSVLCPQNSMVSLAASSSRTNGSQHQPYGGSSGGGRATSGYATAAHICRPKASKKRSSGYRRSGSSSTGAGASQSVGLMSAAGNESML